MSASQFREAAWEPSPSVLLADDILLVIITAGIIALMLEDFERSLG